MYVGYEPPTLGFLCRAKPPTSAASDEFIAVRALPENSHQKKSACGSILRKASQTMTKPAICSTPIGLRCYSSRPHSLRSSRRNQCEGYPSLHSWKARKETTSPARGHRKASPAGALQCATSFGKSSPFSVKAANTVSSTFDGL